MMSFYGGPAGTSFEVKKIFRSKTDMYIDLQQRWQSPIGVGDYVFISYGLPSDGDSNAYNVNKEKDITVYKKTYNASLWQKVYLEKPYKEEDKLTDIETLFVSGDYGLGYKLITVASGNTPKLEFSLGSALNADQLPQLDVDLSNIDNPKMVLHLPQNQILHMSSDVVDANVKPSITYDDTTDINNPKATLHLPQGQVLQFEGQVIDNGGQTEVTYDDTEDINKPKLSITIPQTQSIKMGTVTTLDANEEPTVELDTSTDVNNPDLNFSLPRSQVMREPTVTIVGPAAAPSVEDKGTVNNPQYNFSLPRAVQFVYGDKLGEKDTFIYYLDEAMEVGDYYINQDTGYIYQVTEKHPAGTISGVNVKWVAKLRAPLPQITVQPIDPYQLEEDGSYSQTQTSVESTFEDPENEAGWSVEVRSPRLPKFEVLTTFVGNQEEGSATIQPTGVDTLRIKLEIPSVIEWKELKQENVNK